MRLAIAAARSGSVARIIASASIKQRETRQNASRSCAAAMSSTSFRRVCAPSSQAAWSRPNSASARGPAGDAAKARCRADRSASSARVERRARSAREWPTPQPRRACSRRDRPPRKPKPPQRRVRPGLRRSNERLLRAPGNGTTGPESREPAAEPQQHPPWQAAWPCHATSLDSSDRCDASTLDRLPPLAGRRSASASGNDLLCGPTHDPETR
jgi:hypothetical protein